MRQSLALLTILVSTLLHAQNSDPQALSLAAQSLAAMTGGNPITDVTLTGNATWTMGDSQDQGPATLLAKGNGESKVDLQLSGGERVELRDASTGSPLGEWINTGNPTQFALHNCWTDAVWFFPIFSSMVIAPTQNVTLLYVGQTTLNGENVQHLQSYIYLTGQSQTTISFVQSVSVVDYYLDSSSLLPVATTFNTHPDDNAGLSMPIQILFSNYRQVSGVQVPFHVQKFLNTQPLLDFTVSSAVFNSSLPLSDFTVQ
jgi:hypothetical protein